MINKLLIDYVKKISLIEVIKYYDIKISKRYILCPFHEEKTPSARLYEETNTGYCFGCHKLFDSIEIVKKMENLDFEKAVMFLYRNFSEQIFYNKENIKNDLRVYRELNKELRNIVNIIWSDKIKRKKFFNIMQTIDMNAENNLLILKIYQNLLEFIK